MKKIFLSIVILSISLVAFACPACEKQQPKLLRGITHGTGPQSNWDWVIISIMSAITLLVFIYSIKFLLLRPDGNKMQNIKRSILIDF